jgi:hypothetical protein
MENLVYYRMGQRFSKMVSTVLHLVMDRGYGGMDGWVDVWMDEWADGRDVSGQRLPARSYNTVAKFYGWPGSETSKRGC